MALFGSTGGVHFKEPWLFQPITAAAGSLEVFDSGAVTRDSTTTAFFTEMARRGLQDTTNWTSNTYKTLLSVSSGKGLVAALVGCTAGGVETTTFEITVDGVLTEIAVGGLASGERAVLSAAGLQAGTYYLGTVASADEWPFPGGEALDADKATFGATYGVTAYIAPWRAHMFNAMPCLRFNTSLLIRAKHSANITNATATAYSAVMYRLGL